MAHHNESAALLAELAVGFMRVPVILIDAEELILQAVDKRVEWLAEVLMQRRVAVVTCEPRALLEEPRIDFQSVTRGKLIQAVEESSQSLESAFGPDHTQPLAALQLLADSLPDCVIELNPSIQAAGTWSLAPTMIWFVPADIHALACELGVIEASARTHRWAKRPWQSSLIQLEDLTRRFHRENSEWPQDDLSHYDELDPAREAIAKALGMYDQMVAIRRERAFGRAIGEAVGVEQKHGWLATDLKLEHFISTTDGRVAHVDHQHDVFLLRAATARELAACIAPLYQQMNYVLWQAFREGLLAENGATAVQALFELEGPDVLEVLSDYCGRSASRMRKAGDIDRAIDYCSAIEAAAVLAQGTTAARLRARAVLVRGDVLLAAARYHEARESYNTALVVIEELRQHGMVVDGEMCGCLINLALVTDKLGQRDEARSILQRAKVHANDVSKANEEYGAYLLEAIRVNENALNEPRQKS